MGSSGSAGSGRRPSTTCPSSQVARSQSTNCPRSVAEKRMPCAVFFIGLQRGRDEPKLYLMKGTVHQSENPEELALPGARRDLRWRTGLEVLAAVAAAARRHGSLPLLRHLGDERLRRQEETRDRRGVLQRRAAHLGRIDDAGLEH